MALVLVTPPDFGTITVVKIALFGLRKTRTLVSSHAGLDLFKRPRFGIAMPGFHVPPLRG